MYDEYSDRHSERRRFMRRNVYWIAPLGVVAMAGFFLGIGVLVEWLWRVTLVDLFAIKPITFWQAWGLILLSQILFKANIRPTVRTGRPRERSGRGGGAEAGAGPASVPNP